MIPTRDKFVILIIWVAILLASTIIGASIYISPIKQTVVTIVLFLITYSFVRRFFNETWKDKWKESMVIAGCMFIATCGFGIIMVFLTVCVIGNGIFQIVSEDTITKTAYALIIAYSALLSYQIDVMDEMEGWK